VSFNEISLINYSGMPLEEARKRIWFIDSQGLVVKSRTNLAEYKLEFAHEHDSAPRDLLESVRSLKPTTLIGIKVSRLSKLIAFCRCQRNGANIHKRSR